MIAIAAIWISVLLIGGGFALDRVLTGAITRNFDSSLEYVLIAMIRSSEIGPDGEVRLIEPLGDQRFLEPYSGLYWQISGAGQEPYRSRSLWERTLRPPREHVDTVCPGASSSRNAERRQVTVMFCDMVRSTELSGRFDPEDMSSLLRHYREACSGAIASRPAAYNRRANLGHTGRGGAG